MKFMIKEKAYAKINLGLQVVSKREDGYHNLQTVMVPIDLYDSLIMSPSPHFILRSNWDLGPEENNLVFKVYSYMKEKYSKAEELKIYIKKSIPVGAGLGGGSADAAATIRGLNKYWKLNLTIHEMENIAFHLGSDIPFCIRNIQAIATGRGEKLTFLDSIPPYYIALVIPPYSSYTKEVFNNFDIIKENKRFQVLIDCLTNSKNELLKESLFNDLEAKVRMMKQGEKPSITEIKTQLIQSGCIASSMSGSGSSVYGIFLNRKKKKKIKQDLTIAFPECKTHIIRILKKKKNT